jgi:two-component system, OmpR family, sensor kinase
MPLLPSRLIGAHQAIPQRRPIISLKSLHLKFFVLIALLVCANGGLALYLQERTYRHYDLMLTQALNQYLASNLAAERFAKLPLGPEFIAEVKTEFGRLMAVNPNIEIYLLDADGRIEAFTAPRQDVVRQRIDVAPLNSFIGNQFVFPLLGDDPKDLREQKIFSAAYCDPANPQRGFLYIILGGSEYDAVARRLQSGMLLRNVLTTIALGLVVALAAAFFVLTTQTGKLRRLAGAIDIFRESNFQNSVQVPVSGGPGGDELDRLSRAYNEMITHIRAQMEQIAATNATRRELIASISHDLRTPLASLRGYLETLMLKEKTLSPQDRRMYLEIAFRQSDYMSHLIEELFELAKLEAVGVDISPEPIQLSELVQDVILKFKLLAEKSDLRLEGRIMPHTPLVYGDIALVERMLGNLLDNAIRHTPRNGTITVSVAVDSERAHLEVADTGSGITNQDLPHIFERFYRADKSRDPASGGGGLGLAIVKRIVDLHGGQITVNSTVGVGTRFEIVFPTRLSDACPSG